MQPFRLAVILHKKEQLLFAYRKPDPQYPSSWRHPFRKEREEVWPARLSIHVYYMYLLAFPAVVKVMCTCDPPVTVDVDIAESLWARNSNWVPECGVDTSIQYRDT